MDVDESGIRYMPANYEKSSRFAGKNAIVTAGTMGIGRAIVQRLANDGCRVFLCSRKQPNVDALVKPLVESGLQVGGAACNVTRSDELEQFIVQAKEFFSNEPLHFVVSNVGVNPVMGDSLDQPDKVYDKIMDANVRSHFRLLRLCRPLMTDPKGGSIILTSSTAGHDPQPPLGLYGVSKTALIALGKVLAAELGPSSIRVNTVCPGVIRTKLSQVLWNTDEGKESAKGVDLLRHGDPHEIGGVVAFLCSDDSGFMTGESIIVSGGTHSRL